MSTTVVEEPQYAPGTIAERQWWNPRGPATGCGERTIHGGSHHTIPAVLDPGGSNRGQHLGPQIGSAVGGLFGGSAGAQSGSQIGSAVGGLLGNLGGGINLGGLFGGRSMLPVELGDLVSDGGGFAQPALDLTSPLVQQCTLECLGKITPELATVLQNWYPQMQSASNGSRSAEAEIEALERVWPELSSWVTQQVASNTQTS